MSGQLYASDPGAAAPPRPAPMTFDPAGVPLALTSRPRWVCADWHFDGMRWTKVPLRALAAGRAHASVTDPATWASFPEAVERAFREGWGIGFVLAAEEGEADEDRLAAWDFDHAAEGGVVAPGPLAQAARLDSYTEFSVSGTGLHVYALGTLPAAGRRRGPVEAYGDKRFVVVTGRRVPGVGTPQVEERQAEMAALWAEVFGPADAERPARPAGGGSPPLSDDDVIARARGAANGARFTALWAGDTGGHGDDDSAADLALCGALAFWTQDEGQIDRLFRRSGLYRRKWERPDYRARTLARALDRAEVWQGPATAPALSPGRAAGRAAPVATPEQPAWEPPVPLPAWERPEFPVGRLPAAVGAFVAAVAVATQTPPALAASLALGVLAACCQQRVEVRPRDGWTEPACLWLAAVLGSGNRKSAAAAAVTAPLLAWEREQAKAMGPKTAEARNRREIAERRLAKLQKTAAENDDAVERGKAQEQAAELRRSLLADADLQVPSPPRLLVEDATPEAVGRLLADHGERLAVVSAEGTIFSVLAGKFSKDGKTSDLGFWLKLHSAEPVQIDRIGREARNLERPTLTLALAVQPAVLDGLAARPDFRGQGLLARLLWGVPESTVGRREVAPPAVPQAVSDDWGALVGRLLALPPALRTVRFSPAADRLLADFQRRLEPRLGPDGDLGHVADWGSKLPGAAVRVAGVLHVAETVGRGDPLVPEEVPATTVSAAIGIAEEFWLPHALAAFGTMGADPRLARAERLLRAVGRLGTTFTRRELHQAARSAFPQADQVDPPLRLLVEHGFVRPLPAVAGPQGGRPSPAYEVNPALLAQNPQNTQNPHGGGADGGARPSFECSEGFEGQSAAEDAQTAEEVLAW